MADALIKDFIRLANPTALARVTRNLAPSECWNWIGANHRGYGYFRFRGKNIKATHVALILAGHGYPNGRVAMHSCDNPRCINHRHLAWGTQQDNMADMRSKGREAPKSVLAEIMKTKAARGEAHGFAKITDDQVRAIRADTRLYRFTAAEHGISEAYVSEIKSRRKRADVE